MGIIITLAVIAIIIVAVKKSKGSKASPSIQKLETQVTLDSNTDFSKFQNNEILNWGLNTLLAVVSPDKHGDFNDAKKVGKTIAQINSEVSTVLQPGSQDYIEYFNTIYENVIYSMRRSQVNMQAEATEYTLLQQYDWETKGKCQTFVKGLSEDPS